MEKRDIFNNRRISYIIALSLLIILLIFANLLRDYFYIKTYRVNFSNFPMIIDHRQGILKEINPYILKDIGVSNYILIDYLNPIDGSIINCYIAYYAKQLGDKKIHSPISCFLSTGWIIKNKKIIKISIPQLYKNGMNVNLLLIQRGDNKKLILYWYQSRSRILTNQYVEKLYLLYDALVKHRTDGALIRLSIDLTNHSNFLNEEKELISFAKKLEFILVKYLPS